jgi:hypothetical protein
MALFARPTLHKNDPRGSGISISISGAERSNQLIQCIHYCSHRKHSHRKHGQEHYIKHLGLGSRHV